jgi:hypothetical protein
MSFVAKPSDSAVPFAQIRSLEKGDPLNGKVVYLQRNTKSELKALFDEAKARDSAGLDDEECDYEPSFPSASAASRQRRPSRTSVYDDLHEIKRQRMHAWAQEQGDPELVKDVTAEFGPPPKSMRASKPLSKDALIAKINKLEAVKSQKEISLSTLEIFEPVCNPEPDQRDVVMIAGPSGSGKSTWANDYALSFNREFPNASVFIFSVLSKDKAFTMRNQQRILIDDEFVQDPIQVAELENSLCIFDDIDHVQDEGGWRDACYKLRDAILEIGRHKRIYLLVTTHELFGGKKKTSVMKREASCVVMFPSAGMNASYSQYLKSEHMLTPTQIRTMLGIKSHWVALFGHCPKAVLSERKAYILS